MPLAVDTNVLVRVLADDGSEHAAAARTLFRDEEIFVPETVILEAEWVLRSAMKLDRGAVSSRLSSLLATPNVHVEGRVKILKAVLAHASGLDFADAMHLYASSQCEAMITFDERLIREAPKITDAIPVRKPQ